MLPELYFYRTAIDADLNQIIAIESDFILNHPYFFSEFSEFQMFWHQGLRL